MVKKGGTVEQHPALPERATGKVGASAALFLRTVAAHTKLTLSACPAVYQFQQYPPLCSTEQAMC